jgi:hypothetical protein
MGAWDNAPEPGGPEVNFVSLKDGDKFIGRVESVEIKDIPAGTMPNQPADLVDIPHVLYTGRDGAKYEFKYTTAVLRNGILRLKPEPGTWVFNHRIGKAPGKAYVNGVVREATPEEVNGPSVSAPAPQENRVPSTDAGLSAPAGPVQDSAPPF